MSLILREWVVFNPMYEIRSFACGRKLTAASQYQEEVIVPWMIQNKDKIKNELETFFYSKVEPTMDIDHACIDFAIHTEIKNGVEQIKDIFVIELNSFGFRTGSNMFDWGDEKDYEIMTKGPYEFRVNLEN